MRLSGCPDDDAANHPVSPFSFNNNSVSTTHCGSTRLSAGRTLFWEEAMSAVHVREELVPLLNEVATRSADFEQQRHISDDIIARFKQIGVYRALVPKFTAARSVPGAVL